MNNKILYVITAVWVLFFIGIYALGLFERPTTFNELGDFLAGVFAPLGFLWLIYGYRQQGKQLQQNTRALEQQEKALQLQISEMKESVQQQKKMFKIQNEQIKSTYRMVQPALRILDGQLNRLSNKEAFVLQAELENIGLGIARSIYLNIDLESGRTYIRTLDYKDHDLEKYNLEQNKRVKFKCYLHIDDFLTIDNQGVSLLKLKVQYEDVYKNIYSEEFLAGIEKTTDQDKFLVYF